MGNGKFSYFNERSNASRIKLVLLPGKQGYNAKITRQHQHMPGRLVSVELEICIVEAKEKYIRHTSMRGQNLDEENNFLKYAVSALGSRNRHGVLKK